MSTVVSKRRSSAAGICDSVHGVAGVVGPDGGGARVLFGDVFGLQTAVTSVGHRRVLIGATAFRPGILANLGHLIAHVVGVDGARVDAAALPVEEFGFDGPPEDVGVNLLLPSFDHTAIKCTFIRKCHDFTTGTTTTGVSSCLSGEIGIGRD